MLLIELIVDNFAGGGGASVGIAMAIGRSVDIAINHDPKAIAMHKVNHPETKHYCESVWDIDPVQATGGRPVALCWFSPDCKHFSKAKGGKPLEKNIRGLAWLAVRWAATVRPRVIILENVEEFKTWGPLLKDGQPDKAQIGRTFNSFINALHRLGYAVDWRELKACDYGAPTIRKRFFLIARCDDQLIRWPEPTHGDPGSEVVLQGRLKPWRTAAEIIDWSLPCRSIFERKKPLAENTLQRIAKGLKKFVLDNPSPFIVQVNHSSDGFREQDINQPLQTVTVKHGYGLVTPYITKFQQNSIGQEPEKPIEPIGTITAGGDGKSQLITAFLAKYYGGGYNGSGAGLKEPASTVTTIDHNVLVTSHLVKMKGQNTGQKITEPIQTITAGGLHFGEVRAFLVKYYGTAVGQSLREPLHTMTTKERLGIVTIFGQEYRIADIGMRMLEPHELYAAQGFPAEYIINFDVNGKPYPKSAQVARCGNAVPPPFAEALVRANLAELCTAGESVVA